MALAETTVVETVSGGWPQVLSGPEVLLEANQLAARRGLSRDRWLVHSDFANRTSPREHE
jgi:hypothetical protein